MMGPAASAMPAVIVTKPTTIFLYCSGHTKQLKTLKDVTETVKAFYERNAFSELQ